MMKRGFSIATGAVAMLTLVDKSGEVDRRGPHRPVFMIREVTGSQAVIKRGPRELAAGLLALATGVASGDMVQGQVGP